MRHNRGRPKQVFLKKNPWYKRLYGWMKNRIKNLYSVYKIYRNVKKIL